MKKSTKNLGLLAENIRTAPNLVIAMPGVNDMIHFYIHWKWPKGVRPLPIEKSSPFAPANQGRTHAEFREAGTHGRWFPKLAKHYREHPKLERLSKRQNQQFQRLLDRYSRDLSGLAQASDEIGAPLLLATQPLSYGTDPVLTDRWCLYINPKQRQGFVPSPALMAEMLSRTNAVTRQFASTRGVPLVDLADLTGRAPLFYDQWHFSIQGAERAGRRLGVAARKLIG